MPKTNRNDPCSCGSGKKYKKCCLTTDSNVDFRYRRWQRVESVLIPKLLDFAFEAIGPKVISDGWNAFFDDEIDEEFEPDDPMNMVFMPWCFFSWRMEFSRPGSTEYMESTIADLFLNDNRSSLTPDEETLLLNYIGRPFSLCEIVEIRPGVGMTQFDLLRRVKYEVAERTASQTLKRGEIIYCATTELDGIKFNIGTSPYALRPIEKREIQRLRKWILDESQSEEITEDELDDFSDDIRGFYLDTLSAMFAPPSLATTDGDPWVPHKVHFELKSADKAFHQLKDLAEGASESDLLADAVVKGGRVTRVDIPWSGGTDEARTRFDGPILLGLLKIDGQRLVVEVNSVARAELVRKLIEERCKGNATYKSTLIEPIESAVREMWNGAAAGQSARAPSSNAQSSRGAAAQFKTTFSSDDSEGFGAEDYDTSEETESSTALDWTEEDNDAEIRAAMQALMKRHWETWIDLPVPALNDLTPREASKTDEGRELLESLLLDFEIRRHGTDDHSDPDIAELRRNLGM